MAGFSSFVFKRCNTIEDAVNEYITLQKEFFPELPDMISEIYFRDPSGTTEKIVNKTIAELIADMDIARDWFRRHDEMVKKWDGPEAISYPVKMGVI